MERVGAFVGGKSFTTLVSWWLRTLVASGDVCKVVDVLCICYDMNRAQCLAVKFADSHRVAVSVDAAEYSCSCRATY